MVSYAVNTRGCNCAAGKALSASLCPKGQTCISGGALSGSATVNVGNGVKKIAVSNLSRPVVVSFTIPAPPPADICTEVAHTKCEAIQIEKELAVDKKQKQCTQAARAIFQGCAAHATCIEAMEELEFEVEVQAQECSTIEKPCHAGSCADGQCACDLGGLGGNCSGVARCAYWDEEAQEWSAEGCELISMDSGESRCACDHLTHFGMVTVLASSELYSASLLNQLTVPSLFQPKVPYLAFKLEI